MHSYHGRRRDVNGAPVILGLDSAAAACSAALWRDGGVAARRLLPMARGHAEALVPLLVAVLEDAGARFADLTHVAVTVGPGSFTGLRVGLAAARGIGLAAGLPVIGIGSFEAVAEGVPPDERAGRPLLVVLDSRRTELFAQGFAPDGAAEGPPVVATPADLARRLPPGPWLLAGDAAVALRPFLAGRPEVAVAPRPAFADAAAVARLGAAVLAGRATARPARPAYLRAPEARLPGAGR